MKFDVVILGAGSGGEMLASLLSASGKTVAIVEENLIGGECPFFACMPSKAMLRSASARREISMTVLLGATSTSVQLDNSAEAFAAAVARRNKICDEHKDDSQERNLRSKGISIVRGRGKVVSGESMMVNDQIIYFSDLVIATGSQPFIPPIEGLNEIDYWTTDAALTSDELPESLIIVGGGPAGCELAQIYSGFGTRVTIIEPAPRLVAKEEPKISQLFQEIIEEQGIEIAVGSAITKIEKLTTSSFVVHLENELTFTAAKLLVTTGRQPRTADCGLEKAEIKITKKDAVEIDENCRAVGHKNIWALGDVAGIAPLVHTANYQARVIADGILGKQRVANYVAIPRAVYTSPSIASVGMTLGEALAKGISAASASYSLADTSKYLVDGSGIGLLILTADLKNRVLLGAAAVGPRAEDWIAESAQAIRAGLTLDLLTEIVHSFPSYGEAYEEPIRELLQLCNQEIS
jgi:dihydrolipoamide dehydrogenase